MPAEGLYLLIARVATAYYFLHFLVILPVLGFKEKTLPIPLSITEPVLGGSPNLAMAKNKESLNRISEKFLKLISLIIFLCFHLI